MKIKLFDARDVQGLYGVVVPHLDYGKSLTEREEAIRNAKAKVAKRERQMLKNKAQNKSVKVRRKKMKEDSELEL